VVMIIIGILAAIAIPIFLSQRKKAEDSAAKADVSTLGKEIATYWVDAQGTTGATVSLTAAGRWEVNSVDVGKASNNVELVSPASGGSSGTTSTTWCVQVKNDQGDKTAGTGVKYSAKDGMVVDSAC